MRKRMRKIHKKLLDFSYTFFPDIGREGGREGQGTSD